MAMPAMEIMDPGRGRAAVAERLQEAHERGIRALILIAVSRLDQSTHMVGSQDMTQATADR